MPQPNKIPSAFAASGDKNTIPESTETTGLASWRDGFPAITSASFSEGGIAPKRADFNGIFYALSQAVMWLQQGGVYVYDVNTDYESGNVVLDAGGLYVANSANGPSSAVVQPSTDTTGATWKLVRLNLATQSAAGYMSAADKLKLDGINLSLYALLNSPSFTGTPTAPTPATTDNSTKIATTAFVNNRFPYTSGSWTPVLSAGGDITFNNRHGRYWRYGDLVNVIGIVTTTKTTASPSGNLSFSGLPFVPADYYGLKFMGSAYASGGVNDSFRRIVGCSVIAGDTPEVHFTVLSTTTPAKTRWYTSIGSSVSEFGVALTPSAGVFQLYFQVAYWIQ